MPEYIVTMYQGRLVSAEQELFTVDDPYALILKDFEAINTDPVTGFTDTLTVWLLPPGAVAVADRWIWIPPTDIGPGERISWGGGDAKALHTGYQMWAGVELGSSSPVNVHTSGMLVSEVLAGT